MSGTHLNTIWSRLPPISSIVCFILLTHNNCGVPEKDHQWNEPVGIKYSVHLIMRILLWTLKHFNSGLARFLHEFFIIDWEHVCFFLLQNSRTNEFCGNEFCLVDFMELFQKVALDSHAADCLQLYGHKAENIICLLFIYLTLVKTTP